MARAERDVKCIVLATRPETYGEKQPRTADPDKLPHDSGNPFGGDMLKYL
jgi:hypothetical protein